MNCFQDVYDFSLSVCVCVQVGWGNISGSEIKSVIIFIECFTQQVNRFSLSQFLTLSISDAPSAFFLLEGTTVTVLTTIITSLHCSSVSSTTGASLHTKYTTGDVSAAGGGKSAIYI